jgi:COMM domain
MSDQDTGPTDPAMQPLLHALDGEVAPAELSPALRSLLEIPAQTLAELGELILPNLEPMPEDQLDSRIARLCRRRELDPATIGPGIKATVFLFRQAAVFNVEAEQLAEDLATVGGSELLAELLIPLYREVFPELRREIAMAAIAAHGNVLTNVEWRMDTVGSTSRGRHLNIPVALVTMHFRNGTSSDSITLQMMPDAVGALRVVCDHLLNR